MDFLDPRKRRAHHIRLMIGYGLMAVAIVLTATILVYWAYGYGFNTKTGGVVENGLLFVDSAHHPGGARQGAAPDGGLPGRRRGAHLREPRDPRAQDHRHGDSHRQSRQLGTRRRSDEGLRRLDRDRHRRGDPPRLPPPGPRGGHLHGARLGGVRRRPDEDGEGGALRSGLDPGPDAHGPRPQGPGHRARVGLAPHHGAAPPRRRPRPPRPLRSEEHTSELQSQSNL